MLFRTRQTVVAGRHVRLKETVWPVLSRVILERAMNQPEALRIEIAVGVETKPGDSRQKSLNARQEAAC